MGDLIEDDIRFALQFALKAKRSDDLQEIKSNIDRIVQYLKDAIEYYDV